MLTSDPKLQLIRFFHRLILESFWSSLCANNTGGTASNPPRTSDSSALFPASLRGFYSRFNCLVFFRAFESTGFRQLTFLTTSFFLGLRGGKKKARCHWHPRGRPELSRAHVVCCPPVFTCDQRKRNFGRRKTEEGSAILSCLGFRKASSGAGVVSRRNRLAPG